jgi:hypothetical protein
LQSAPENSPKVPSPTGRTSIVRKRVTGADGVINMPVSLTAMKAALS